MSDARGWLCRASWWLAQREYDYEMSRYDPLGSLRWLGSLPAIWRYLARAAARAATTSQPPPAHRRRHRHARRSSL